ncbi:MAG: putative DNA-binding domain-containing protein [Gammaproteobacteria bacterium]|nr:putative DNA-binding domain-containing protein [Gammaproteobacteria bacterium]
MNLQALQNAFQDYVIALKPGIGMRIRSLPGATASQRLEIYAEAYRLRLAEVLRNHFPVLAAYLGEHAFDELAVRYIDANPSSQYSVRWFGGGLEQFLRAAPLGQDRPLLAELAGFEWRLNRAFDAADSAPIVRAALAALPASSWPALRFVFQPGLQRFKLNWNVVEIWKAIDAGQPAPAPETGPAKPWLVWRQDLNCRFRPLPELEASVLDAARSGMPFAYLCELVDRGAEQDDSAAQATAFLQRWIADKLVCQLGKL